MKPDQVVDNQTNLFDCGRECKCDLSKIAVSLQVAVLIGSDAVQEDYNKNYKHALQLYKQSEKWFLHAINYDYKKDEDKECLREYCKKYTDRAAVLELYLEERKRIQKLKEIAATKSIR